ncbi:MAG: DUF3638 domain-containing protein [Chlamydiales bacterium]|nr:DUF3638 domain-containing protein [Chlamydiales bacterium]
MSGPAGSISGGGGASSHLLHARFSRIDDAVRSNNDTGLSLNLFQNIFLGGYVGKRGGSETLSNVVNFVLEAIGGDLPPEVVEMLQQVQNYPPNDKISTEQLPIRAEAFAKVLRALPKGKRALLPGGFIQSAGGHRLLYLFEKTSSSFNVWLINPSTSSFHSTKQRDHKVLFCPYLFFQEVPEGVILPEGGSTWVQSLLYFLTVEHPTSTNESIVYAGPFLPLWQFHAAPQEAFYVTNQRGDTCNWRALMVFLRLSLGDEAKYKYLKIKLHHYALESVAKGELSLPARMVQEAVRVFAKELDKKAGRYIDLDEVERMRNCMEECCRRFPLEPSNHEKEALSLPSVLAPDPNIRYKLFSISEPRRADRMRFEPTSLSVKLGKSASSFGADLAALSEKFSELSKRGMYDAAVQFLAYHLFGIPISLEFWDEVENREEVVKQLEGLMAAFFESGRNRKMSSQKGVCLRDTLTAQEFLIYYSIYLHTYELAKRIAPAFFVMDEVYRKTQFIPYRKWIELLGRECFFQILSPQTCMQYDRIIKHVSQMVGEEIFDTAELLKEPQYKHRHSGRSSELDFYENVLKLSPDLLRQVNQVKEKKYSYEIKEWGEMRLATFVLATANRGCFPLDLMWLSSFQRIALVMGGVLDPMNLPYAWDDNHRKWESSGGYPSSGINFKSMRMSTQICFDMSTLYAGFERSSSRAWHSESMSSVASRLKSEEALRRGSPAAQGRRLEAETLLSRSIAAMPGKDEWVMRAMAWASTQRVLQPLHLLTLFQHYPNLFDEEKFCSAFWVQFFKGVYADSRPQNDLDKHVRKNSALLKCVKEFVKKGVQFFLHSSKSEESGSVASALFFVRVATEFACAAASELDAGYIEMLCDFKKMIEKMLKGEPTLGQKRGLLHMHLLHLNLKLIEIEKCSEGELFASWFGLRMFQVEVAHRNLGLEKELEERLYPHLERWSERDEIEQELLDNVVDALMLPPPSDEVKKRGNVVEWGSFVFNIFSGAVLCDELPLVCANPDVNRNDEIYVHLFGGRHFTYFSDGEFFLFTHPEQGPMRLSHRGTRSLHNNVQLQRGGVWYQFVSPAQLLEHTEFLIPYTLVGWPYCHWIAPDQSHIVITHIDNWQKTLFTLTQDGKIRTQTGHSIQRGEEKCTFSCLERPEFQEVHYKPSGELYAIHFPHLLLNGKPLAFFRDDQGRLIWNEDPHFALEDTRDASLLPVEQYVVLRNFKTGKQKVLVKVCPLDPTSAKLFVSTASLLESKDEVKIGPRLALVECLFQLRSCYIAFDLDGEEVQPSTLEGHLYLAFLLLHAREFDKVAQHLGQLSLIDHLSPQVLDILRWIVAYPEMSAHDAPIPTALALRAAHLLKEHEADVEFSALYRRYLDMLSHIPFRFHLPLHIEQIFASKGPESRRLQLKEGGVIDVRVKAIETNMKKIVTLNDLLPLPPLSGEVKVDRALFVLPSPYLRNDPSLFFWSGWEIALKGTAVEQAQLEAVLLIEMGYYFEQSEEQPPPRIQDHLLYALYFALKEPSTKKKLCTQGLPNIQLIGTIKSGSGDYGPKWTAEEVTAEWWKDVQRVIYLEDTPQLKVHHPSFSVKPLPPRPATQMELTLPDDFELEEGTFFKEKLALFEEEAEAGGEATSFPAGMEGMHFERELIPCVQREMAAAMEDHKVGAVQLKGQRVRTLSDERAGELKAALHQQMEAELSALKQLEMAILEDANRLPGERAERLHRELELQAGKRKPLGMEELEKLFLLRSEVQFKEANGAIADVPALFQQIARWEVRKVVYLRLMQALELVEKLEGMSGVPRRLLSEKIAQILEMNPAQFAPDERVPYLVFHRLSQKFPRADQRETVAALPPMNQTPCCVQMIMGAGKTSVVAPLWAYRCTEKGKMPVIFADSSQYLTLGQALKHSQKTCFGQEVFTIDYPRQELTLERLQKILQALEKGKRDQKLLIMCPEMLQLLDLERFMAIKRMEVSRDTALEVQRARLFVLNAILKIFKEECKGLCDEADLIFRTDKEVNLPCGEVQHISQKRVILTRLIFEMLCSKSIKIGEKSLADFVGLERKEQTHLTKEDWAQIVPAVARHLMTCCPMLKLANRSDLEESFIQFVGGKLHDDGDFLHYVRELHASSDLAEKEAAELICLAKHLFQDIFPNAFRQTGGRHFGRWRDQGFPIKTPGKVIPYYGVDSPAPTEFAHPYEALVKHFLHAVHEGIEKEQVQQIADDFILMARLEMQRSGTPFQKTAEACFFERITGVALLDVSKPGKLEEATKGINRSVLNRLYFEGETANRYATFYQERLTSTAQDFFDLSDGTFSAMTGTPWNQGGFPPVLADRTRLDVGTQGKINQRILQRKESTKVETLDAQKLEAELDKLFDQKKSTFPAAIFDAGALLSKSGFTNVQVAETILHYLKTHGAKQRGVLFFFKPEGSAHANQFAALVDTPDGAQLKLLSNTSWEEIAKAGFMSSQEYVVYLPERQTTGTDVPLPLFAEAYVTVDETITMRTLQQAIMRLRSFLGSQRAHFIFSPAFMEKVPQGMHPIDFILRVAVINEARQKAHSMLRAYKQILDAVVKKEYRRRVESWTEGTSQEEIAAYAELYQGFFFAVNTDTLFEKFLGAETEVDAIAHLEAHAQMLLDRFDSAAKQMHTPPQGDRENIQEGIAAVLDRLKRPEVRDSFVATLRQTAADARDLNAEVLQEAHEVVQEEKQVEEFLETQLQLELEHLMSTVNLRAKDESLTLQQRGLFVSLVEKLKEGSAQVRLLREEIAAFPDTRGQSSYRRFANVFDQEIYGTDNYFNPTCSKLSLFHPASRPPGNILVVQKNDGSYCYVLLSSLEARHVLTHLQEESLEGVWLIEPSGHSFLSTPETPADDSFKEGIVELCILFGALSPLYPQNLMGKAKVWVSAKNAAQQCLRLEFLKMRLFQHPYEKSVLAKSDLLGLGQESTMKESTSVVRSEEEELILTPHEIQLITDPVQIAMLPEGAIHYLLPSQVPHISPFYVKNLVTREQIREVKDVWRLSSEQAQHVSPAQAIQLTSLVSIQALPQETIQEMKDVPLPDWIRKLKSSQVGWITNPGWVKHLQPNQCADLSEEMQAHLDPAQVAATPFPAFERFADSVIAKAPGKVGALSLKRVQAIRGRELVEHITDSRQLNALHPSCAPYIGEGLLSCLISEPLIKAISKERLHFLSAGALRFVPKGALQQVEEETPLLALAQKAPLHHFAPKQLVMVYRKTDNRSLQGEIKKLVSTLNEPAYAQLLTGQECEEMLLPCLVSKIQDLDKLVALHTKFQYISVVQLLRLIDEGKDLSSKREQIARIQFPSDMQISQDNLLKVFQSEVCTPLYPQLARLIQEERVFAHLPLVSVPHANPDYAHRLTPEQRKHLTEEQVGRIKSKEALRSLDDITHINVDLAHLLTDDQRVKLTPKQIGQMRQKEAIFLLGQGQHAHVHPDYRHHLPFVRSRKTTILLVALTALGTVATTFSLVSHFTSAAELLPSYARKGVVLSLATIGATALISSLALHLNRCKKMRGLKKERIRILGLVE